MPPTDLIKLAEYGGIALSCLALGVNGSYYKNLSVDRGKKTAGYFFMGACAVSGTTILSNTSGIDPNITTGIWLCSQVVRTVSGMVIEHHPYTHPAKQLKKIIEKATPDLYFMHENIQKTSDNVEHFNQKNNNPLLKYWQEGSELLLIITASYAALTNQPGWATAALATSTALSLHRLHQNGVPELHVHAAQKFLRTLAGTFPICASLAEIATLGFLVKGRDNSKN